MRGKLSARNAGALLIIIQISKIMLFGFPGKASADLWISILLLVLPLAPLMLLYARLVRLSPGKDLYQMMEAALGRTATVVLCIVYAYYFLSLSGVVRGNFAESVHLVSLYNTPFIIVCLAFFVICSYLAYSGSETMGKWGGCVALFTFLVLAVLLFFSAPKIEPDHIVPILEESWLDISHSSFLLLAQPFGEAIMLLCLTGDLDRDANPYKLFLLGSLISVTICLLVYFYNCATLGQGNLNSVVFPSYKAASIIHIGSVGTRIEGLIAFAFILQGVTKVTVCMVAGTRAVAAIFKIKEHRALLHSVGFLSVAFSSFVFHNIIEMFEFFDHVYQYNAPFFQILVPAVVWITAEVKHRRKKPAVSG